MSDKPSAAWYLAPIFLGIIGSAIMWYVLKDEDHPDAPKMVKKGWVIGIILTIIPFLMLIPMLILIPMTSTGGFDQQPTQDRMEVIPEPRIIPVPAPTQEQSLEPDESKELGIASFVDESKDPQSYVDRYNNEPSYKKWFDDNYQEYDSIQHAVGIKMSKGIAPFVDPNQDPQYYVDRYNNEQKYKEWFDSNFPEYNSIYDAVGLNEPTVAPQQAPEPIQTQSNCDSSYPDVCVPVYPPDLDCGEIQYTNFKVLQPDPHGFDGDKDGIGCESSSKTTQFSSSQNCSGNARCLTGTVTQVIDGDTIKVDGKSIRFALASAPELHEFEGDKARQFIDTICPVGSTALVDEDDGQTEGSYGRIIGVIYCNDLNLNEELLDASLGYLSSGLCSVSEFSFSSWAQKYGCTTTCDPSYPDVCIPSPPPDLDCNEIGYSNFRVIQPDPHGFDRDRDGIGCEVGSPSEPVQPTQENNCDSSYPDVCIPVYPPDLDCGEIPYKNFKVLQPDPHGFDGDKDGIGCES